jgi:hypothetical protein
VTYLAIAVLRQAEQRHLLCFNLPQLVEQILQLRDCLGARGLKPCTSATSSAQYHRARISTGM